MGKPPVEADIKKVDVSIDRPVDRAAARGELAGDQNSASITGSGDTGTLVANNSETNWYLEHVTVTSLANTGGNLAVGNTSVHVRVRDDANVVVLEQAIDPAVSGYILFSGQVVKPGWDVAYEVEQADSNGYTIYMDPLFRRASESPTEDETVDSLEVIEDFERSSPLDEYVGDTGDYSVITSNVFHGDRAIETTNGSSNPEIRSTGASEVNYPESGDDFSVRFWSDQGYGDDQQFVHFLFGLQDANNYYEVRKDLGGSSMFLREKVNGSYGESVDGSPHSTAETWQKADLVWGTDGEITLTWYDGATRKESITLSSSTFSSGGIGWRVQQSTANTARFDYAKYD